jgi:hypothetical protein
MLQAVRSSTVKHNNLDQLANSCLVGRPLQKLKVYRVILILRGAADF